MAAVLKISSIVCLIACDSYDHVSFAKNVTVFSWWLICVTVCVTKRMVKFVHPLIFMLLVGLPTAIAVRDHDPFPNIPFRKFSHLWTPTSVPLCLWHQYWFFCSPQQVILIYLTSMLGNSTQCKVKFARQFLAG